MMVEQITAWDFAVLDGIAANLRNPFLDAVMPVASLLAKAGIFWIALIILFLCMKRTRKMGITAATALVIGFVITNLVLKLLVARDRPFEIRPEILSQLIVVPPADRSFPSGHTAASFAVSMSFLYYDRRIGIPTVILAAIIGFSRLYLYVHFPTDVIVGALIGILASVAAYFLIRRIYARRANRIRQTDA